MSVIKINGKYKLMNITGSYEKLPVGVYTLSYNESNGEYELDEQPAFALPNKIYGNHEVIHRWLKSYKVNSHKNMGIILSGVKGGGKTITAQKFCIESNLPVIIINSPFEGAAFINFLIDPRIGECIILIDEFEKVYNTDNYYDRTKAKDLLTLMDGTYNTKLIFLLTVNTYNLGEFFINRLGRIKYRKDFTDLSQDIIDEVIEDILINKDHKDSIKGFFERVNICTFDLLTNLIKEMNLFNEDAFEVGKHLNLRAEPKQYSVVEEYGGLDHKCRKISLTPGIKQLTVNREDTDYLPEAMEDTYSVTIPLDKAEVIKIDTTSFIIKFDGFKFKFNEESFSLVF
jgi:hypothetical protein